MIDDLLARVREAQDAQLAEDAAARDAVGDRIATETPRVHPRRTLWPVAAAAIALIGVGAWAALPSDVAIGYVVEGGVESIGGFVAAREPASLVFSDGSRVALDRGASARVVSLDAHGAGIALEHGALEASVVHREDTSWRVYAGPFAVLVTGTRFHVQWDAARAELAVAVDEGAVRVEGACLAEPRPIRAGEHAELGCEGWSREEEPLATVGPAIAPSPVVIAPEPARRARVARDETIPEPAPLEIEPTAASPETPAIDPGTRLEEAQRAVLAGDVGAARTTLLAVRSDAPGSDESAMAAFLLGRLAFDAQHDYAEADRWFAAYESERPEGALIREAMGRRVEALARHGDHEGARAQATRYLARFPQGPHAGRAREILAR